MVKKQIRTDDAVGIFCGVVHVILRNMTFGDIGIERVDSGCQTAAAPDVGFFCYDYGIIGLFTDGHCRVAACCAAADDEDIRMEYFFSLDFHK